MAPELLIPYKRIAAIDLLAILEAHRAAGRIPAHDGEFQWSGAARAGWRKGLGAAGPSAPVVTGLWPRKMLALYHAGLARPPRVA